VFAHLFLTHDSCLFPKSGDGEKAATGLGKEIEHHNGDDAALHD
jgi:hypothetical protein